MAEALPPLVQPGPPLTAAQTARYARHLSLPQLGGTGQRRLMNAKVLVIGAGGLGCPVATYLVAAGVGRVGLLDDDVVDESNLQRQVLYTPADVGRRKVDVAVERLSAQNPDCEPVAHPVRVGPANALDLFRGYDLVVDGTDNFATRYLVNDACVLLGIPYVWGSVLRFEGQVGVFWAEHGPQYRDLYPEPPSPGLMPNCAEGGVLGALCALVGSTMAIEAVKLITGIGRPLVGRLKVVDALEGRWREFAVERDPETRPVESLEAVDYPAFCGVRPPDAPAVPTTSVSQLKSLLQDGSDVLLLDIREPHEREAAVIDAARPLPRAAVLQEDSLRLLHEHRHVVVHCHSGVRSAACVAELHRAGVTHATSLDGGIQAWLRQSAP